MKVGSILTGLAEQQFSSSTKVQQVVPKGTVIFKEGDSAELMYVVKEGEVVIRLGEREIETVGADEIFGEMGLIDGQTRSANAVAKTDCKLVPVDQKRFIYMVQQRPLVAVQVMKVLVDRLRRTDGMVGR